MSLSDRIEFFYRNASWSHNPETQTSEEGHIETATELALAEEWANLEGYTFQWFGDLHAWNDHRTEPLEDRPSTCEMCLIYNAGGQSVASLGCIDDADDDYRRVIEAELALEVMPR